MSDLLNGLTEEQKKKVKKLRLSASLKGAGIGIKYAGLFLLTTVAIGFIAHQYVHDSKGFGFLAGAVNGFMLGSSLMRALKSERERIAKEVQSIFQK